MAAQKNQLIKDEEYILYPVSTGWSRKSPPQTLALYALCSLAANMATSTTTLPISKEGCS
jgi:hypothetical protein